MLEHLRDFMVAVGRAFLCTSEHSLLYGRAFLLAKRMKNHTDRPHGDIKNT